MEESRTDLKCPNCGSVDTPRLIVRGADSSGSTVVEHSVMLHCRWCHQEWSERPPVWRWAS
jgi:uncharacterized Zn finger protein